MARPALETVATLGMLLVQVAWLVTSYVEPSECTPVAVNCIVSETMRDGRTGVRLMLCKSGGFTVSAAEPATAP